MTGAGALDLAAHAARLAPHIRVIKPDGRGPFPVVVQMHGCGGVQPLLARYAEAARQAGVAAVIVDSFAPRGIDRRTAHLSVCTGLRLRGRERAVDLLATRRWLESQPWADQRRFAAAGWSHGGWAIMEALVDAERLDAGLDGLKLVLLFYPYAGVLARTHRHGWRGARPRVVAWLAGRDQVVGRTAPRRALDRLQADGLDVSIVDLPGATHSFDDDAPSDPRTRYRPDLEAEARAAYVATLFDVLVAGRAVR